MYADEDVLQEFDGYPVLPVSYLASAYSGGEVVGDESGGFGVGVRKEGVVVEDLLVELVPFLGLLEHGDGIVVGVFGDVFDVVVDVAYAPVSGVPSGYHDVDGWSVCGAASGGLFIVVGVFVVVGVVWLGCLLCWFLW